PSSAHARNIATRPVARVLGHREGIELGCERVITEMGRERRYERALAISTVAVKQEDDLLARVAGERVTSDPLDVTRESFIAIRHALDEFLPDGRLGFGIEGNRRQLGHQVLSPVKAKGAGLEIDGSILDVQEPRVTVKLIDAHPDSGLGLRQLDETPERRLALRAFSVLP